MFVSLPTPALFGLPCLLWVGDALLACPDAACSLHVEQQLLGAKIHARGPSFVPYVWGQIAYVCMQSAFQVWVLGRNANFKG